MIENNYYFCFDNNSIYKLGFVLFASLISVSESFAKCSKLDFNAGRYGNVNSRAVGVGHNSTSILRLELIPLELILNSVSRANGSICRLNRSFINALSKELPLNRLQDILDLNKGFRNIWCAGFNR